ncbi:CKLF-like MARVEL transmembrane domain-containing protein 7 isoform X1 [Varroa jacobsoni]|uniref:CKLF-like MARVEL transmembrane domain-containing protein 7 isoform X1 n=1 Tax=Varroa jacobsoni TaxID=62625 RepID=UPI000BF3BCB8|nr:CKLF-like MARVEL transmembrane domain-containing protein 7 isoform X1 [Varroa jacobsoni]XP_022708261.1 CKLF-like MARVEL transmembrane domain-containing protein 7 isoform X1 [Varroa jacobsoni]XP_022708262.1 CKLF-like MARVEL transmembrane domain-containing protein 7 isoform X1 [Varroa jacobsoni]XP_022708263.1 CKLF-like MARVEL transmembrane domain-containing protein 7 isoform X1 [Varroa jacobsoni]XP_022708264.1 CKLF-like MARVEL transmembrane domain-containing protein 7 isoform X1 [Varroa jacobs
MAAPGIDASKLAFVLQYFDTSYIRTPPGMLKIAQLVNALIGFILAELASDRFGSTSNWFGFVSMTGFWVTLILLVFYMLHILEKLLFIPWPQAELGYTALWSVLYFIAGAVAASKGGEEGVLAAAALFGFVGMILYGGDAFLKYKAWKSNAAAYAAGVPPGTTEMGMEVPAEGGISPTSPNANYPAY